MSISISPQTLTEPTSSEPFFSILVPTRNGMPYLSSAIESVLAQPFQSFELVVSDNYSNDGTADYLATVNDSRFKAIRPPAPLSMIDHFEYLASQAKGTWMTIIGDDDAVLPYFFDLLAKFDLERIECNAVVTRRAYYFWQGCEELYGSRVMAYHPGLGYSRLRNKLGIFICLCSIITYLNLPQLYTTGIVRRSYFEYVKERSRGRFFYGTSPDASSAVALALHTPRHLRREECLFWTGTSPKSVGFSQGSNTSKTRSVEFEEMNKGLVDDAHLRVLPSKIREQFDWTVIFYAALLAHPNASRIWSSRMMRNFFLAGLLSKNKDLLPLFREAYNENRLSLELKPYKVVLTIVKWFYDRHQIRVGATKVSSYIVSCDRAAYPTLHDASKEVHRVWLEADSHG